MNCSHPRLIRELLRDLLVERDNMAVDTLAHRTEPSVTPGGIRRLLREFGTSPDAETLEGIAHGLGVEPGVFYEWPIAEARRRGRAIQRASDAAQRRTNSRRRSSATRRRQGESS